MRKKGLGALAIVGIVIGVILLLIIGGLIYFYNFYVFETVRVCIGEHQNLQTPCGTTQDCLDIAKSQGIDVELEMEGTPQFFKDKFQEVIDETLYCDVTCHLREIRGVNLETQELEILDACEDGEKEIAMEIRGKEGLALWNYFRRTA